MTVFERMKAAVYSQSPLPNTCEPGNAPLFRVGGKVAYRVPAIEKAPSQYHWESRRGVILAINTFAEMVLIQSDDEPPPGWRWLWWGYAEKVTDVQE
ncbi:MAG: hypothetical protein R3B95_19875 [Nitrospirales bacterium]|nr:hypothetical protein [Nitrospirales bacterium]